MSKSLFLVFISVFLFQTGYTQEDFDRRLLTKYTANELTKLQQEFPEKCAFLNYCLDHAFYLTDLPTEKMANNDGRINPIKLPSTTNINFYELNIELIQDDYQFFAIEGTDQLLVIKSIDHIKKEMKDE